MSYLQKNNLPDNSRSSVACGVSKYGDLVCPSCGCHIITPDYAFVVPGTGRCPLCKSSFLVKNNIAVIANERQEKILTKTRTVIASEAKQSSIKQLK